MRIVIASDHGGYELKKFLVKTMKETTEYNIIDVGCFNNDRCDYPDYAKIVCKTVLNIPNAYGILVCGTGIGIGIAANKIDNIYCALCYDEMTAKLAKRHNNANVISLGGRMTDKPTSLEIVKTFLKEDFEEGRHIKRLNKIKQLQKIFKS